MVADMGSFMMAKNQDIEPHLACLRWGIFQYASQHLGGLHGDLFSTLYLKVNDRFALKSAGINGKMFQSFIAKTPYNMGPETRLCFRQRTFVLMPTAMAKIAFLKTFSATSALLLMFLTTGCLYNSILRSLFYSQANRHHPRQFCLTYSLKSF